MPSTRWYYRENDAANFDVTTFDVTTFDMTTFDTLNYSVAAGIAEIVLDRPPLNLIDEKSTREYHAALRLADADTSVRVIILRGAGKGLSAGVDLHFLDQFDAAAMEDFLRPEQDECRTSAAAHSRSARRQPPQHRQKLQPRARTPMCGQRLVLGVGIPGTGLYFGRKLKKDHAACAWSNTFQCRGVVVVGYELPAISLQYREEAFFILAVARGVGDVQIHRHVYSNI